MHNQSELEREFTEYLEVGKVDKALLRSWYNGYNFAGNEEQKSYNPFDILLFFSKGYQYRSYWFETATQTFLVRLVEKNHYFIPELEDLLVSDITLSNFDIGNSGGNLALSNLLFNH